MLLGNLGYDKHCFRSVSHVNLQNENVNSNMKLVEAVQVSWQTERYNFRSSMAHMTCKATEVMEKQDRENRESLEYLHRFH